MQRRARFFRRGQIQAGSLEHAQSEHCVHWHERNNKLHTQFDEVRAKNDTHTQSQQSDIPTVGHAVRDKSDTHTVRCRYMHTGSNSIKHKFVSTGLVV